MIESRKGEVNICALKDYCANHPEIIEKVAKLETSVQGVHEQLKEGNETFRDMRKEISEGMLALRNDITNGILKRYPAGIVIIITILSSACTALLTLYLNSLGSSHP